MKLETVILILVAVVMVMLIVVLIKLFTFGGVDVDVTKVISAVKDGLGASQRELREEMAESVRTSVKDMGESIGTVQRTLGENHSSRLVDMDKRITELQNGVDSRLESIRNVVDERLQTTMTEKMNVFGQFLSENQTRAMEGQNKYLVSMDSKIGQNLENMGKALSEKQLQSGQAINDSLISLENRFKTLEASNNERLEIMRQTMERRLSAIQEENQKKLDSIQSTVNEKLETQMRKSFSLVSERLEKVYEGLGEMQNIAVGVGDLKKVLSNVKTRGILGEIQLGSILEEILPRELYDTEVPTIPGSRERVEFAVKLPGQVEGSQIYLPIDSKFPGDTYAALQDAYDTGDKERIENARKNLRLVIRSCAKEISEKYVDPNFTTNFGIMFLPFEGLYAEAVNLGLVESLQRDFRVSIAGPSTMAAMLNSLHMGFRTLAIQQRSSEVWKVLGEVKGEFGKFSDVLDKAQKHINQVSSDLDALVGTRTRAMQRKLDGVEVLELNSSSD